MFIRMFHPVGQGAFYSERHDGFNVVYDCGVLPKTKEVEKFVKHSFSQNAFIDILFISHFDADHVNLIPTLHANFSIKRVVLPVVDIEEKKLLIRFYEAIGEENLKALVTDPQAYFGPDTEIIEVEIGDSADFISAENNMVIIELDRSKVNSKTSKKIRSGKRLLVKEWEYYPYNFKREDKFDELKKMFLDKEIDIKQLKENDSYFKKNRAKVKSIYEELEGDINSNSMYLYSGAVNKKYKLFIPPSIPHHWSYWRFKRKISSGCLYTGDGMLTDVPNKNFDPKRILQSLLPNVETIQVPHHGSLKNFDEDIFNSGRYFCPVSVGQTNIHGLPSQEVIGILLRNNCYPILVTERVDSLFVQMGN